MVKAPATATTTLPQSPSLDAAASASAAPSVADMGTTALDLGATATAATAAAVGDPSQGSWSPQPPPPPMRRRRCSFLGSRSLRPRMHRHLRVGGGREAQVAVGERDQVQHPLVVRLQCPPPAEEQQEAVRHAHGRTHVAEGENQGAAIWAPGEGA